MIVLFGELNEAINLAVLHMWENNESSEVFDTIKPGRRVKIKDHRQ